jgi:hypothetical protein
MVSVFRLSPIFHRLSHWQGSNARRTIMDDKKTVSRKFKSAPLNQIKASFQDEVGFILR